MFQGIKGKVQGADHIKVNKPCQDAVDYYLNEKYAVAVVADGHGGKKYIRSEYGSEFAVKASIDLVKAFMEDYDAFAKSMRANSKYLLRKMQEQFFARWTQLVEDHLNDNPLTKEEIDFLEPLGGKKISQYNYYGSTVLIAVMAQDFYYGLLVGDGAFVVVKEDCSVSIPIDDPYSFANYVSSICQRDAIDAFQGFYEEGKPLSITVSSDGLIKSFGNETTFLDYHLLLTRLLDNPEDCETQLMNNINTRSKKGSGDDVSVCLIFDPDYITEKLPEIIKEADRIKANRELALEEKRRAEEKRKAEAERRKQEEAERRKLEEEERRKQEDLEQLKEAQKREIEELIKKQEEERQQLMAGKKPTPPEPVPAPKEDSKQSVEEAETGDVDQPVKKVETGVVESQVEKVETGDVEQPTEETETGEVETLVEVVKTNDGDQPTEELENKDLDLRMVPLETKDEIDTDKMSSNLEEELVKILTSEEEAIIRSKCIEVKKNSIRVQDSSDEQEQEEGFEE